MLRDYYLTFDDNVAITATRDSTNVLDLGSPVRGFGVQSGAGSPLGARIQLTETFLSGGSSTLAFTMAMSADNSAWENVLTTFAIPKARLLVGTKLYLPLPALLPGQAKPRYYKLIYTVGTANFTAGKVSADLTSQPDDFTAYYV